MFMYRGVLVSISVDGNNYVEDIVLYYTNKKIKMNNLKRYQEIDTRIRPTGESTIGLKYKIVNVGCFRVDVDTYIEPGWVGNADIAILENGNISYRDKMYFTFIDPFISQRSWRRKLVASEKISCESNASGAKGSGKNHNSHTPNTRSKSKAHLR